ncbi:helix-turn-helix transcriptional regulator [Falsiroseomonas bella]|nr:helix-turn-helix transcriptional regulator [Falsiroseomonas bella]
MHPAVPRILSAEFTDLGAFSAAMQDGEAENMQLGAGALRLRLTLAEFGPVRVHANAVDNSYLARATVHRDRWAVFFDLGAVPGRSRINGLHIGSAGAVLFGPGAELHAQVAKGQQWAMLTLSSDPVAAMLDGVAAPGAGQVGHVPDLLHRTPALAALARDLALAARADPARLERRAVGAAVTEQVMGALVEGLAGAPAADDVRAGRRQLRLVGSAVEYLEAALEGPVYTQSVCAALDVGPRALNAAFRSVYGVTLQQYLLTRRLNLARSRLREPEGPVLVKQIALDAGFWHFGRFSLAYRRMFGETPSATLANRPGRSSFVPGVCAPPYSAHIKTTR